MIDAITIAGYLRAWQYVSILWSHPYRNMSMEMCRFTRILMIKIAIDLHDNLHICNRFFTKDIASYP